MTDAVTTAQLVALYKLTADLYMLIEEREGDRDQALNQLAVARQENDQLKARVAELERAADPFGIY